MKILEGNPGNRRLPQNEPEFPKLPAAIDPPDHLTDVAKEEWRRLMPVLLSCGMMTMGDLVPFEVYCSTYARWRHAEAQLKADPQLHLLRTPNGHVQSNPWITISRHSAELMKSYLIEFGLTPAARARMGAAEPPAPNSGAPEAPKLGGRFAHLLGSNNKGDGKPN